MGHRKHISYKTKLAAALRDRGEIPYDDAKLMTDDQLISLYHFDHGILHETGHEDRDKFWNLTPRLIRAHRDKTKLDQKIIAKGKRIRAWTEGGGWIVPRVIPRNRIASRGFDKTRSRRMDGTVTQRTQRKEHYDDEREE